MKAEEAIKRGLNKSNGNTCSLISSGAIIFPAKDYDKHLGYSQAWKSADQDCNVLNLDPLQNKCKV